MELVVKGRPDAVYLSQEATSGLTTSCTGSLVVGLSPVNLNRGFKWDGALSSNISATRKSWIWIETQSITIAVPRV